MSMASSTAAASSFSLLHSSSPSSAAIRFAATLCRRLGFSGTTNFFNYLFAEKTIGKLSSADFKGIRVFASADLYGPPNNNQNGAADHLHLIDNGARVSSHFVRKKTVDRTYQLTDAHSKYRQAPLSRVSGLTTVAATLLPSRSFCSRPSDPIKESQASPLDYGCVLQEDEFHKLADSTINDLLEKLEEYGDSIDIDGFDIDCGSEVLTLKLGSQGTYVVNKQTPNRQIWLSSPISGPARFDWDSKNEAWIYRRNQANLYKLLESEIGKLCGQPLKLS